MKKEDAAKILGINGLITKEITKKAYRVASSKYHPDKGGSVEMMQAVNQAYETLKDYSGQVEAGDINYGSDLNTAINKIINLQGLTIEVCGAWVWVTGETKQYAKILGRKEGGAGFFFAKKKAAWYYRPADWKSASRGSWSLDKIRNTHGTTEVKTRKLKAVAAA